MPSMNDLTSTLERELIERYGLMLSSRTLWKVLCYPTAAAWRQSICRGTVPVPIFRLPGRSGYFALAHDVAAWMAAARITAKNDEPQGGS